MKEVDVLNSLQKRKSWILFICLSLAIVMVATVACARPAPAPAPAPKPTTPAPAPAPAPTPTAKPAPAFPAITLKVSSPWPDTNPNNVTFRDAWDLVNKRTNGAVKIQEFHAGSLGGTAEQLDLAAKGTVDVVNTNQMYTIGKTPIAQFEYSIPFPPPNPEMIYKAKKQLRSEFPVFGEVLEKLGAKYVANIPVAPYSILSKSPIKTLDDFKGKKIGVIGTYFGKWVEVTGAVPVVAAMPDRYQMLQSGLLDIDLLFATEQFQMKHHEVTKNFTDIGIGTFGPVDLIMNLKTWNGLSPELQKIIMDAADEAALRAVTQTMPAEIKKARDAMKAAGVAFFELSDADKVKWAAGIPDTAAQFATDAVKAGYTQAWDFVKRYQDIIEQMGYKWPRRYGIKP